MEEALTEKFPDYKVKMKKNPMLGFEYIEVAKPADISKLWAIHQFARRNTMRRKLKRLFSDYQFTSFREYYFPDEIPKTQAVKSCAA